MEKLYSFKQIYMKENQQSGICYCGLGGMGEDVLSLLLSPKLIWIHFAISYVYND